MKTVFLILLVVNAAFFAFMRFSGSQAEESSRDHAPIQANKIKLLSLDQPLGASSAAPPAPAPTQMAAQQAVCLEWGSFAGSELIRVDQALASLKLGDKLIRQELADGHTFWVFLPAQRTRQAAEKKVAELKAMGIEDVSLVQENTDKWRNVVSLGVFSTEEAASKYLEQLNSQGVKNAKIEARAKATSHVNFLIQDASESVSADLVKLKLEFPGSELKAVACTNQKTPRA